MSKTGKRYYNINSARQPARGIAHTVRSVIGIGESFETVSKNLKNYPYVITYNGDDIDYITYTVGAESIIKTFNYTLGVLTNIVLSGDTPAGITLTKTLHYTGDDLTDVNYS